MWSQLYLILPDRPFSPNPASSHPDATIVQRGVDVTCIQHVAEALWCIRPPQWFEINFDTRQKKAKSTVFVFPVVWGTQGWPQGSAGHTPAGCSGPGSISPVKTPFLGVPFFMYPLRERVRLGLICRRSWRRTLATPHHGGESSALRQQLTANDLGQM